LPCVHEGVSGLNKMEANKGAVHACGEGLSARQLSGYNTVLLDDILKREDACIGLNEVVLKRQLTFRAHF
jgi:hypothetical protein